MLFHDKNKIFFIRTLFFVIFFVLVLYFFTPVQFLQKDSKLATITFKNTVVLADVSDTRAKQIRGLSGRPELNEGRGMWFDFSFEGIWGIWMKEMNFPIDILWFDKNFTVIYIKESALPESYPEVFTPLSPSRFVLEVPAGFVKKYSIILGDVVFLK